MRHLRRLVHCLAAGALSGAALAPLQLLMWPDARISAAKAVLAALAWSSWGALWLGGLSFLVMELIALARGPIAVRRGIALQPWRWLIVAHAALVAAVAFYNRDTTRELLVNVRRSGLATSGWLVAAVFLAALVVALRRRTARRPLLNAVAIAAPLPLVVWFVWATTPFPPPAEAAPVAPSFTTQRRLLLVSWEGADLPWLVPAIERGDMPFLRTLWDRGAWGQTRTVRPFSRAAALATLATGCRPAIHGVLGHHAYRLPWLTPAPVSLLLEGPWPNPSQLPWRAWELAATPAPRRAPLWDILLRSGAHVGLAGWPGLVHATWVVPRPLAAEAIPFSSLDGELQAALQPALAATPDLAPSTRTAFAIDVQVVSAAAMQCAAQPVEALIVDCDLPERLRPLWTVTEGDAPRGDVLTAGARLLDEQLRDMVSLVGGDDALIVVMSPYGMAPPSPWRRLEQVFGRPNRWKVSPRESPDGFVLFAGPGVRRGARLRGSRLADVAATILYLLELPVARDMAGRVLLDAVTEERTTSVPLRLVPSYPPTQRTGH